MNKNKEKYYNLILFDNINEPKKFIFDIITMLICYEYKYNTNIDNKRLKFNNNLCVCNIVNINKPEWKSECNFIINDNDNININHYRLIIYKFDDLIYYIELNGNIHEFNKRIKNFKYYNCRLFENFKLENKDGIDSTDKLHKKISDFLLNKDDFNYNYKKFCNKYRIPLINYINDDDNEFSYNNIINLYEDLITNKILDSNKKLNNCDLNNNENRYYDNVEKYNFLNLDNSDIYYDKENKLLFNYKTDEGYSLLCFRIIYSLIILKTKPKKYLSINFINKFDIDINNFKYVIGIIKSNDYYNQTFHNIDFKIGIGIICYFLNKLNIEYYIDFI